MKKTLRKNSRLSLHLIVLLLLSALSVSTAFAQSDCSATSPIPLSQTFCAGAKVSDIVVTGSNVVWYSASGGSVLPLGPNDQLSTGAYRVVRTLSTCTATDTVQITVNSTPIPSNIGESKFQTLQLSGFTDDLVANGIGLASSSTTNLFDLGSGVLVDKTFRVDSAAAAPKRFLPAGGLINSVNTPGLNFQLQSYSAANSLRLSEYNEVKELTVQSGKAGNAVYLLGASGNGSSQANITVVFEDNTSQSFPFVNFADWYGGGGFAIKGIGRVLSGSYLDADDNTENPRLYEIKLSLDPNNFSKKISRIVVKKTNFGAVLNIMAASLGTNEFSKYFCEESTIANMTATGENIKWYNAAGTSLAATTPLVNGATYYVTQTIDNCPSESVPVTVEIRTKPAPPATTMASLCQNANLVKNLSVSGQEGATFNWYESVEATTPLAATTSIDTTKTIYVTQTVNGCESTKRAVEVTIKAAPAKPTGVTISPFSSETYVQNFCGEATAGDFTVNAETDSVRYYVYQWEATSGNGWWFYNYVKKPIQKNTPLNSYADYAITAINASGCESVETKFKANITTRASVNAGEDRTICAGTPVKLAASGYGNLAYQWSGGVTDNVEFVPTQTQTYILTATPDSSYYCPAAPDSVTITVMSPAAPTAVAQKFCVAGKVNQLVAVGLSGATFKWYASATDSVKLADSLALSTQTYYVSQTSSEGCESPRTAVAVTINPLPAAPTITAQSFCGSKTVADLSPSGANIKWYADATSTAILPSNTPITSSGTYYVSQTSTAGCESPRTAVSVAINPLPAKPTAINQQFCTSGTVGQLLPNGSTIRWYDNLQSTTPLSASTALTTKTYYVSAVNAEGCESERVAVSVKLVTPPAKPTASTQVFCGSGKVSQLTANGEPGAIFLWYSSATATTPLSVTTPVTNASYYVSQIVNGCESARTKVDVCIKTLPNKPWSYNQTFWLPTQVWALVAVGSELCNINWYETATSTEPLSPFTWLRTKTYYVSQTVNGCESARLAVKVTVWWSFGAVSPTVSSNKTSSEPIVTESSLSIATPEKVSMYPNPARDVLNITAKEAGTLQLVTMQGRVIKSFSVKANEVVTIPTDGLMEGNYRLIGTVGNQGVSSNIAVQK